MKRLLITGGSGYLGRKLVEKARKEWAVAYTYLNHPIDVPDAIGMPLDILEGDQVLRLFRDFRPHAVIHTAYSQDNLDVIVKGTKHVARASEIMGTRLIHLSTDAVFDGKRGWYHENDIPAPIHPYGKAKAEAELMVICGMPLSKTYSQKQGTLAVRTTIEGKNAVIVRTSLIWGLDPMDMRTLYLTDCLKIGKRVALFTDEYRCPVYVDELATAILELLSLDFRGIIHIAGPERISRYEFGMKLAQKLGLNSSGITPGLSKLSEKIRPLDCSIDTSLAQNLLRTKISSASELLA
jgi:dTDP-4-dehydrorhamnose reductase